MTHGKRLDVAAEKLLAVLERHTEKLPETERKAKWDALEQSIPAGTRAKSATPPGTPAIRRPARKHA